MTCCILYLIFMLLIFVTDNLALDSLAHPVPNSDCPLIDDINHAVMLPYHQDCSKYFSCLKGMAYLQQCPNDLHWSTLTYRCDYPDKASCEASALPVAANANALPVTSTGEIRYQAHSLDCSKYYTCRVLACPSNYYWNSGTQKCDFPHNAHCPFLKGASYSLETKLNRPLQMPPYQGKIFTLHYPNDCAKFYECQTMLCPYNYHWNARLQQCDLPQTAECSLKSETAEIMESSTAVIPTAFTAPPTIASTTQKWINGNGSVECLDCVQACDGYLHHYMPHPEDCHKFIQCNGWRFVHTCPDNLFWNAKLNTCDRVCVAK